MASGGDPRKGDVLSLLLLQCGVVGRRRSWPRRERDAVANLSENRGGHSQLFMAPLWLTDLGGYAKPRRKKRMVVAGPRTKGLFGVISFREEMIQLVCGVIQRKDFCLGMIVLIYEVR